MRTIDAFNNNYTLLYVLTCHYLQSFEAYSLVTMEVISVVKLTLINIAVLEKNILQTGLVNRSPQN